MTTPTAEAAKTTEPQSEAAALAAAAAATGRTGPAPETPEPEAPEAGGFEELLGVPTGAEAEPEPEAEQEPEPTPEPEFAAPEWLTEPEKPAVTPAVPAATTLETATAPAVLPTTQAVAQQMYPDLPEDSPEELAANKQRRATFANDLQNAMFDAALAVFQFVDRQRAEQNTAAERDFERASEVIASGYQQLQKAIPGLAAYEGSEQEERFVVPVVQRVLAERGLNIYDPSQRAAVSARLARMGREEFVTLVRDLHRELAPTMAELIRAGLKPTARAGAPTRSGPARPQPRGPQVRYTERPAATVPAAAEPQEKPGQTVAPKEFKAHLAARY